MKELKSLAIYFQVRIKHRCDLNQEEGTWNNDSNSKEATFNAVTNLLGTTYMSMAKNDYPKKEMYIITPIVKKNIASNCRLAACEG